MRGIALSLAMAVLLTACGAAADSLFELPAGFRLSGGFVLQENKVTVNALPNGTGTVTVNRVTWSAGGSIPDSRLGFKDLAPYGGAGFSENFGGLKVSWDVGAMFGARPLLPRVTLPGIAEDLAMQNDYIESHTRTVAVQPIAELSFSLKF